MVRWLRGHLNITTEFDGQNFFTWKNGVRYATSLFLALVLVEVSDLIFAVDSIPAIFVITTDPFIVLTSNIFAILGLRAMYFLLAGVADRFSLAVVAVIMGASVWASLRKQARTGGADQRLSRRL